MRRGCYRQKQKSWGKGSESTGTDASTGARAWASGRRMDMTGGMDAAWVGRSTAPIGSGLARGYSVEYGESV